MRQFAFILLRGKYNLETAVSRKLASDRKGVLITFLRRLRTDMSKKSKDRLGDLGVVSYNAGSRNLSFDFF